MVSLRFQDFLLDEDDEEEEEEEAGGSAAGRDYQVNPVPVQASSRFFLQLRSKSHTVTV